MTPPSIPKTAEINKIKDDISNNGSMQLFHKLKIKTFERIVFL
jgi:hypothetical protein